MSFIFDFIEIPDFSDETVYVEMTDASNAPYDWTGSTFSMPIGRTRGTGTALVTLTQADGDIVPSIVSGWSRITWRFRPEKIGSLQAGTYVHDIIRTVDGRPIRFGSGILVIVEGVKS